MAAVVMQPAPGERRARFVGDRVRFTLAPAGGGPLPAGWRALLRTNLGRAAVLREEIIHSHFRPRPLAGASWRDIPMRAAGGEWALDLPLTEVGFFYAKAYAVDPHGRQHWPDGPDFGVSVHPDFCRSANTIYCAFARQFGPNKTAVVTKDEKFERHLNQLDRLNFTVIPPSGKLRDVIRELPHIFGTLGCRILHLLPINPTPTTRARFGRFGSPYASQDLLAIDPALVEHENRTTGVDQFRELTWAAHQRGGRLFLDLAINHTGWGATLQELHPEWFVRDENGNFVSPGAWGVTWGDLVEIEHRHPALWEHLSEVFLEWCRRGVDGFRCDAGYKVPLRAWQFITARVREEFPNAVFLLEGLGGAWELTENLLCEGGMQWAYSELFQEFSGAQVAGYLDHALKQSQRVGLLVHYSETHDNNRLAAISPAWSLLRNRLCALASVSGGFGFTNGVEWLATEKIFVHQANGLAWGSPKNIVPELSRLTELLSEHPCFFDGARIIRLSPADSPVLALRRDSADRLDTVLILANTDADKAHTLKLSVAELIEVGDLKVDLLGQALPKIALVKPAPAAAGPAAEAPHAPPAAEAPAVGQVAFELEPAAVYCLAAASRPKGLAGEPYRRARAQAAWALGCLSATLPMEQIGPYDWRQLAEWVAADPERFLACLRALDAGAAQSDLLAALRQAAAQPEFPHVITWRIADRTRIVLVPPGHWLLVRDTGPFRVTLRAGTTARPEHLESVPVGAGHVAAFAPRAAAAAELALERYEDHEPRLEARVRFLGAQPDLSGLDIRFSDLPHRSPGTAVVLLTNGLGGMARLGVDLGAVQSKYDCALGANLHPAVPVDRHIFAKRLRVWCNADGFITPLNGRNLIEFTPGPPATWRFVANAGDGRAVEIRLEADLREGENTALFRFSRPAQPPALGRELPPQCDVRLTVRFDLEDRNFHTETHRNSGTDHHFSAHTHPLRERPGFAFTPAPDRQLWVYADHGAFHPQPEWSCDIPHPVERTRGQVDHGDAFSPGWFDLPLARGAQLTLAASAHRPAPAHTPAPDFVAERLRLNEAALAAAQLPEADAFGRRLAQAARAFVVRRDEGKTVIAGYPWFLDWGRDSLICARGLLAAGMVEEVRQLLAVFGRFEENGTLPNTIYGENASNRDTSDAPLWFGVVCEDLAQLPSPNSQLPSPIYDTKVDARGRTIADVLAGIARGYLQGTPNGIKADPASGLVWSPSHFTWMDTNHPAATPREGYPIEIQVLWIRLLRQLERIGAPAAGSRWGDVAQQAEESFEKLFWLEDRGWFADVLLAPDARPAADARPDDALRSNQLFAVSLGRVSGERARRCVQAALRHLVVPGALRSLAPLPVSVPLPIAAPDGRLLNDPVHPYQGRYEGDEDTRRKPAYHNGTAWTWTYPTFCEALARAWDWSSAAVATARAYLAGMDRLLTEGCLGHVPEILDGDAPHTQRGCDAQAWGATEALRVWKLLAARSHAGTPAASP